MDGATGLRVTIVDGEGADAVAGGDRAAVVGDRAIDVAAARQAAGGSKIDRRPEHGWHSVC